MKMLSFFKDLQLTEDQQKAIEKIEKFLNSNDKHIFILKGYAGTGKTTLIKGVKKYLEASKINVRVMAPTGRAAQVLRNKVGSGKTIHSSIYDFEKLLIKEEEKDDRIIVKYIFPLSTDNPNNEVLIVDEASMISSKLSQNELFQFGSGVLLNDLLEYANPKYNRNKIIFVGDPAQLPPVNDSESYALKEEYFKQLGFEVDVATLEEVVRQESNTILENAKRVRELLYEKNITNFEFKYSEDFKKINSEDIASEYIKKYPVPDVSKAIIIAFSNQQCLQYNMMIREKLFPGKKDIVPGDIVIVVNNNYHSFPFEVFNGDMAKVTAVSKDVIRKVIRVNKQKSVELKFRKVRLLFNKEMQEVTTYIVDSLLYSKERDLTVDEIKALFIDFNIRFSKYIKKTKKQIEKFSPEYKELLKKDPLFNALRVKFGYAITCHKAQGGEWDTVFVDYYSRNRFDTQSLRWNYTALTRAVKECYVANPPVIKEFDKFEIVNQITKLHNIPDNALSLKNIPPTPFHSLDTHPAKRLKYWEVVEKLENTPYKLINVESLGGFQERYTIKYKEQQAQFDAFHNKAGIFKPFRSVHSQFEWEKEALEILNAPVIYNFEVFYNPSFKTFESLYNIMRRACDETGVVITNIEEQPENYFIKYYLQTGKNFSILQFYFNKSKMLTKAFAFSTDPDKDELLKKLIEKLKEMADQKL